MLFKLLKLGATVGHCVILEVLIRHLLTGLRIAFFRGVNYFPYEFRSTM